MFPYYFFKLRAKELDPLLHICEMLGTTQILPLSSLTSAVIHQLNNNYSILEESRYAIKLEVIKIKINLSGIDLLEVTYNFKKQIQSTSTH